MRKLLFIAVLFLWANAFDAQQPARSLGVTSQSTQQSTSPTSSQPSDFRTALIAAIGALIGVILKDLAFKLMEERRGRKATLRAVYSKYADPLSSSAVTLMWRLHEALEQPGRGKFLKLVEIPVATNKYSTYDSYKKLSTLYRLAVLLGWIRACRREFSYLKVAELGSLKPIESAIYEFEHALADGPDVEIERLVELCKLWGFQPPADENRKSSVAIDLEATIDEFFQWANADGITLLTGEQKSTLVHRVAKTIANSLNMNELHASVLQQSCTRAIQIIDIKEAWIYRDWQSAIGDLMIRPIEGSERRFDVIGFSEFESMFVGGTPEHKKWISRLSAVFDGIDMSRKDPFDHRPAQLTSVLLATASLITALSRSVENTNISIESLSLAERISARKRLGNVEIKQLELP